MKGCYMRLLFIFTGGTIGSTIDSTGYISTSSNSKYTLIEKYEQKYKIDFIYDTIEAYSILSENLSSTHINLLSQTLNNALQANKYNGIIITHGTDTLQYTACAMEYMFDNAAIPIVFISSNFILDDEKANGIDNLRAAVQFIKHNNKGNNNGIYVSYKNTCDMPKIHKPSLLEIHSQYKDDITSIENLYYGLIKNDTLLKNNKFKITTFNPKYSNSILCKEPNILYMKSMPCMTYPTFLDNINAILIDTFHSGTINTSSKKLYNFSVLAQEKNIPIFLTGIEERTAYESTKCFKDYNLVALPKASVISMYIKLWLLISNNILGNDLVANMTIPISYEFLLANK